VSSSRLEGGSIVGYGRYLRFDNPDPSCFDPKIIATSLSRIPRYCGHTTTTWSVAAHTILVASMVKPSHLGHALLHDVPEIVTSDIPAPVRELLVDCPALEQLEVTLLRTACERYGVQFDLPEAWCDVHNADLEVRRWEKTALIYRIPGEEREDANIPGCMRYMISRLTDSEFAGEYLEHLLDFLLLSNSRE